MMPIIAPVGMRYESVPFDPTTAPDPSTGDGVGVFPPIPFPASDGALVGRGDGAGVGTSVGIVGALVGTCVGEYVGTAVGIIVG